VDGFEYVCTHRALTTDAYWFDLDEYKRGQDTLLAAHIRFDYFTPSVLKDALRVWRAFRQCVTAPVIAIGEVDDAKWERFVTLFGFRYCKEAVCINGKKRRLFIHTISDGHACL
jgi:hypothetical protein